MGCDGLFLNFSGDFALVLASGARACGRVPTAGGRRLLAGDLGGGTDEFIAGLQAGLAAAGRFGQESPDRPGQDHPGHDEDPERVPPGQHSGNVPGDEEPDAGTDQFPGQDEPVDPAAFGGVKQVPGQRRHGRPGGGHHRAEGEAGEQQHLKRRGGATDHHGHRPDQDGPRRAGWCD